MSERFFENIPTPKPEKTTNYRANINDWAAIERKYDQGFADKIDEDRAIGSRNIEKLNLPRYKHVSMELCDFLKNTTKHLNAIDSEKFYISLIPNKDAELKRQGRAGLSSNEVIDFISEFVSKNEIKNYKIAIEQMFDNIFGGTTVVDEKGNVYFEFIEGNQTAIGKGNAEIKNIVFRDVFTGSFKYSFEDEIIRKMVFDAIMSIPHTGEGRELKFLPGYYEMVIAQRNEKSKPETKFLDYRDNDAYQIDWNRANLAK